VRGVGQRGEVRKGCIEGGRERVVEGDSMGEREGSREISIEGNKERGRESEVEKERRESVREG